MVVKKHSPAWLKELEDTSLTNKAEGQDKTSASCTKLLENGRDPETSTARESSTDVDVDLEIFSKKSKLEQHNTNAADEIFLVKDIMMAV